MEKTVKLNGKELRLASSLFTIISYRSVFGSELFDDVEKLEKALSTNKTDVGRFIDVLFRLIYVLHKPFYNDSYDHFLQSFDFSVLTNIEELTNLANVIGELLGEVKKQSEGTDLDPKKVRPRENITANIIFNLAQLGIPIRDAEFFDIATYLDIVKLQKSIYEDGGTNRQATQADIDAFLG